LLRGRPRDDEDVVAEGGKLEAKGLQCIKMDRRRDIRLGMAGGGWHGCGKVKGGRRPRKPMRLRRRRGGGRDSGALQIGERVGVLLAGESGGGGHPEGGK
jgi:hypothetical protein